MFDYINLYLISTLQISYNDTFGKEQLFTPLFNKEWLLKLLELQQDIESLVTKNGVSLKDICYAPMSPQVGFILKDNIVLLLL